jgi:hypothetical protein
VASFASVLTSLVLYSFLLTVMALMAPAHLLVTHQELFLEYAYPTYYIGYDHNIRGSNEGTLCDVLWLTCMYEWSFLWCRYVGAMAVGMCSSLSCLESAPSLLKGVADDRVLRILNPLDLGRVRCVNQWPWLLTERASRGDQVCLPCVSASRCLAGTTSPTAPSSSRC